MPRGSHLTDQEILRFIQFVIGLTLFVMGVYMVGPWYVVLAESSAFGILAEMMTLYTKIVSVFQILSGLGAMYGAVRGNNVWTTVAVWGSVSMYALIVVTRLVNIGFIPFIWLFQTALMLIAGALAIRARER